MHYALCKIDEILVHPCWDSQNPMQNKLYALLPYALWPYLLYYHWKLSWVLGRMKLLKLAIRQVYWRRLQRMPVSHGSIEIYAVIFWIENEHSSAANVDAGSNSRQHTWADAPVVIEHVLPYSSNFLIVRKGKALVATPRRLLTWGSFACPCGKSERCIDVSTSASDLSYS